MDISSVLHRRHSQNIRLSLTLLVPQIPTALYNKLDILITGKHASKELDPFSKVILKIAFSKRFPPDRSQDGEPMASDYSIKESTGTDWDP